MAFGKKGKAMATKWTKEKVRELREAFDETQEEFARRLRVSVGTIQCWEQGKGVPSGLAQAFMDLLEQAVAEKA